MTKVLSKIDLVRRCARALAGARAKLTKSVAKLTAKIDAAHATHMPKIRQQVGAVADAEAKLRDALRAAPECFQAPRTIVEAGVKCGYQAHDESLELPTDKAGRAAIVAAVKKMFTPEVIEQMGLIEKVEVPDAEMLLEACSEKQLEQLVKLGAVHTLAGDHLLIKTADSAVDKTVKALLKVASDAAKEEEAA